MLLRFILFFVIIIYHPAVSSCPSFIFSVLPLLHERLVSGHRKALLFTSILNLIPRADTFFFSICPWSDIHLTGYDYRVQSFLQ